MQATFNMGAALIMARVGAGAQDISQLIPFLLRVWRYFCGVMYSIAALPAELPDVGQERALLQPGGRVHLADQVRGHVLVPGRRAGDRRQRREAPRFRHPRGRGPAVRLRCVAVLEGALALLAVMWPRQAYP